MGLTIAILSIFFAACPLLLAAMVIWFADVYNRKPIWTAILALAWGAIMASTGALIINTVASLILTPMFGHQLGEATVVVGVAPIFEEITKGSILLILLFVPRSFESATNGLVLGAMVGFGFAITENFLYYTMAYMESGAVGWVMTIILRTLFSTFIHVMCSGMIGLALGYGAGRGHHIGEMIGLLLLGYICAVGLHASWNLAATLGDLVQGSFFFLGIICFFVAALFILITGIISISRDRKILQYEFEDEARMGVLSFGDSFVLTRWTRRDALKFLFPKGMSNAYQKTALRLAVVKHQNRQNPTDKRMHEIERLRYEIRAMQMSSHEYQQSQNMQQMGYYHSSDERYTAPQYRPVENGYQPLDKEAFKRRRVANMPFREDSEEEKNQETERRRGPHTISTIDPREFRRRVRAENNLDRSDDEESNRTELEK